jgi:predicted O-methyltransferase YrrM
MNIKSLLFCLIGSVALHGVELSEDWNVYQEKVLKEKTSFPGWCPEEKAKRIMNLLLSNPSDVCVEVGVYGGSSFFPMASALAFKKNGIAFAIDPWTNEACVEGYEKMSKHDQYWGSVDLAKAMNTFIDGMHRNGLDAQYCVMRMTSAQAFIHFEDGSIDFLHIDGNHSEQSAIFDVEHWLPKVKKGGIICFDDAWWKSTQAAIKIMREQCDILPESSPKWQYIFLRKK